MAKLTKKGWVNAVVKYLGNSKDNKAKELLQQHEDLEAVAERKRESAAKRRLMNKISNKETVKVEKAKTERLKEIIAEAQTLIG